MTNNQQSEQKLDQFLKANRPPAPEPKETELQKILSAIEAEDERRKRYWWKIAVPALVAASLALFLLLPTILHDTHFDVAQRDTTELETFLDETIGVLYSDNGFDEPDVSIGSEWLTLVE